jgi:ATP-dependent RNA helicase RhlE
LYRNNSSPQIRSLSLKVIKFEDCIHKFVPLYEDLKFCKVSLEILKLNKQITDAMVEAGFEDPKEIQAKTMSRILGGQDIIALGPKGSGKTTTLVLSVLMKLKYPQEEAPRALILVPYKEDIQPLLDQFEILGKYTNLRTIGLFSGHAIDGQKDDLAEGVDIVIGTPERVQLIYQKSGLNLNKLKMFILDDTELIVKQGFKTPIMQLAESLPKCQHLVFTEVLHGKLEEMVNAFLNFPTTVEVSEELEEQIDIVEQALYHVPNYKTKLNLLNILLKDKETFFKIVIFANSQNTIENLSKFLESRFEGESAIFNSGLASVEEFLNVPDYRILLVANENADNLDLQDVPFILHIDIPQDKVVFIDRVRTRNQENYDGMDSLIFATDIELIEVKRIEQKVGQKFPVIDLPSDLLIEKDVESKVKVVEVDDDFRGAAFHDKKASNAKDYNWTYKERLKTFGKKHRKSKKGE